MKKQPLQGCFLLPFYHILYKITLSNFCVGKEDAKEVIEVFTRSEKNSQRYRKTQMGVSCAVRRAVDIRRGDDSAYENQL